MEEEEPVGLGGGTFCVNEVDDFGFAFGDAVDLILEFFFELFGFGDEFGFFGRGRLI